MGLVLKIPVVAMLYLVWWACRQTPDPAEAAEGDDGHGFRRWRPSPKPPRRGPHGPATPAEQPVGDKARRAAHAAPRPALAEAFAGRDRNKH
jgi:hypothetical protein